MIIFIDIKDKIVKVHGNKLYMFIMSTFAYRWHDICNNSIIIDSGLLCQHNFEHNRLLKASKIML